MDRIVRRNKKDTIEKILITEDLVSKQEISIFSQWVIHQIIHMDMTIPTMVTVDTYQSMFSIFQKSVL